MYVHKKNIVCLSYSELLYRLLLLSWQLLSCVAMERGYFDVKTTVCTIITVLAQYFYTLDIELAEFFF